MVPSKSTDDDVQCSCIIYRNTQWRKEKTKIVFFFISGAFSHLCATRSILPCIVIYALYNVKDIDMYSLNYSECIYINDVADAFLDAVLLVGIGFQMKSDFIERLTHQLSLLFLCIHANLYARGIIKKFSNQFRLNTKFHRKFFPNKSLATAASSVCV